MKASQFACSGGVLAMYEFSISSSSAVITNLTKSTDGRSISRLCSPLDLMVGL
jgi:hypothetical protein